MCVFGSHSWKMTVRTLQGALEGSMVLVQSLSMSLYYGQTVVLESVLILVLDRLDYGSGGCVCVCV